VARNESDAPQAALVVDQQRLTPDRWGSRSGRDGRMAVSTQWSRARGGWRSGLLRTQRVRSQSRQRLHGM